MMTDKPNLEWIRKILGDFKDTDLCGIDFRGIDVCGIDACGIDVAHHAPDEARTAPSLLLALEEHPPRRDDLSQAIRKLE